MKLTITETYLEAEREEGDPLFYGVCDCKGESAFLYYLKNVLNAAPYSMDLIKQRMWKDGHLVDELQSYLRNARVREGQPVVMIYNDHHAMRGLEEDWRRGKATLAIHRGTG